MRQDVLQPLGESEIRSMVEAVDQFSTTLASPAGEAAREYLAGRGLGGVAEGARLGLVGDDAGDRWVKYAGRLAIPFVNADGDVVAVRFRSVGDADSPKYMQPPGVSVMPYRPWSVGDAGVAHVTEGELDALSLVACGFGAVVGFPGASTWRDYYKYLFDGCERVFVWADADEAGLAFAGKVTDSVRHASIVHLPAGSDVNSLLVSEGADFLKGLVSGGGY